MIQALRSLINRVIVDRSGVRPQLKWLAARLSPDVEVCEPQGLHFIAPAGARGVGVALSADPAQRVALGLGGDKPTDDDAEGEGGLHYLGTWKVFLAADGTVHLGAKTADDWVPLDSKIQTELARLKDELDAVVVDIEALKAAGAAGFGAVTAAGGGPAALSAWNGATSTTPTASPADPGDTASSTTRVQS
jgi:hypothetical protein